MTKDLTTGNATKAMITFAIPLMVGNIVQQLYNVADTIIVGKFIGPEALAAVGSSFTVMVFLTSIILGLCMGASVLFSQFFGAGKESELKNSIVTAFLFIGGAAIVINLLSIFYVDEILQFINIDETIFGMTKTYISTIFYGMGFVFVYNFFSSLLRGVGNSVVPLIFLIISAVMNVVLDIVLITVFDMGVAGAAYATVAAQCVCAIATATYCFLKLTLLKLKKEDFVIRGQLLKKIATYSILTSIQQSIMNLGILLIQGLVNTFGMPVMAAFAAAAKIDAFAYMPVQDFGNAFATYIAQNKGAGKQERIKKGIRSAFCFVTLFCMVVSALVVVFAKPLMLIFVKGKEVEIIAYGVEYLSIVAMFYCFIGYLFLFYGLYRGLGRANMSIVLTVISLGLRVMLAYRLAPTFGLTAIWWAIPIGWFMADITGTLYFFYLNRRNAV